MRAVTWTTVGSMLALLAIAGCKGKSDATAETAPPPVVLGPENFALVEQAELTNGPPISGSLMPELAAQVRAEVSGSVIEVVADQGMAVKKGTVLARIDETAYRDAWLSARATVRTQENNLQVARRNAERTKTLADAGAVAERELEQAQYTVTNAEGLLADARARLATASKHHDKTTVRAPFAGVVSEAVVSAGDVVQPGGALFTVVDPRSMRLEASVPASELAVVKVGTPVEFSVSGYGDRTFTGRISRVNPAVDPATRQVRIYVALPNADNTLVAGLFAEGRVSADTRTALVAPRSAVDVRGIRPVVMRLKGGRVERVEVRTGLTEAASERIEILQGLAAGDTLLLGSAQGIAPGTVARIRSAAERTDSAARAAPAAAPQTPTTK